MINDRLGGDFKCLILNDDFVLAHKDVDKLYDWWDLEADVMTNLGLIRQNDKSFLSEAGGVFCEIYWNHFNRDICNKISYYSRLYKLPYLAHNITQAK